MNQYSKYDSEFCGNIPIHIINTVQEYGALLVLDKALMIQQASENISLVAGDNVRSLPGRMLVDVMGASLATELQQYVSEGTNTKVTTIWEGHYVVAHIKTDMILLEIEIKTAAKTNTTFTTLFRHIKTSIQRIESAVSIEEVCRVAAEEVKLVSGFDKVMIYCFDQDWNGNVLSEAMEPDMESYLGFTFPASDIPKPARDLYLRNPYRFIPDRTFTPVKLYPVINPITRTFLDMSDCNLRAVAAVHVEYLKNMNVTASMSTRIIHENNLWGLIACHHKTARDINSELCALMELLSSVISAKIGALLHKSLHDLNTRLNSMYTQLVERIYQSENLVNSLLEDSQGLMEMLAATGIAVTFKNQLHTKGVVPDEQQLEDLLLWLHIRNLKKVYHTDSLSSVYDIKDHFREIASGMLVIPIRASQDEYIILFRKEYIRTANWGGNPEERIFFEENPQIYHPRHSFKLWQEHVKGFSRSWLHEEIAAAEDVRSFIFELLTPGTN